MHIGVGGLGAGYFVLRDGKYKFHMQHLLIPQNRFLGVFAAVGYMVYALQHYAISSTPRRI